MTITSEEIIKLLLALLVGGAIGMERELHHKAAGFRTITLISVGAALFSMLDMRLSGTVRIAANIVTGIGFLGAGVIMRDTSRIKGLTTAATVWVAAALGMAIGVGAYLDGLVATGLVLVVMNVFIRIERRIDYYFDKRHYELVLPNNMEKVQQVDQQIHSHLRVMLESTMKHEGRLVCTWEASGTTKNHEAFVQIMLADPEVYELTWV